MSTNQMTLSPQSPSARNWNKTKDLIRKMKDGSPKVQNLIKQKCQQRMKERRFQSFSQRRLGFEEKPQIPKSLSYDFLDPDEALELETQILAEEEEWVLAEYERMLQEEEEYLCCETYQLICPVCQKSELKEISNHIVCHGCDFKLEARMDISKFRCFIDECVNRHSNICTSVPDFLLIPENNNTALYLVCQTCAFMDLIM